MSDTAGGTLHGRDPKQSEGNTSLNKETPTHLERQSGAVTAAGAAFILLTLLALRPFTYINPALPLETHFKLIPSYGVNLASFLIFAFAAVATILRWKRWRIWAGAAAWLAMFLAFRSFESIALTTRFLSQGARINPEQLIVSLLMLAISVFVLWMWNQERKTAATNIKSEVTVGGIALVFLGIYIFFPTLGLLLSSNPAGLFFSVISLIFVFAGLAMVLRWRGWRIWAGTVSWLTIVITVTELAREVLTLATYGFIDLWRLTFCTFLTLVCVFVLWAKRQDKTLALQTAKLA
jgi:hypothetical protein